MGRYDRRFDWEAATRMYRVGGESLTDIARHFGVSPSAVARVVKEGVRERQAEYHREWQRTGVCPLCGSPMNKAAEGRGSVCHRCAGLAKVTSVRAKELRCGTCGEWKPDRLFPGNRTKPHRRFRGYTCTACGTVAKRAWRERHAEQEREYQRAYYKRVVKSRRKESK